MPRHWTILDSILREKHWTIERQFDRILRLEKHPVLSRNRWDYLVELSERRGKRF